MFSGRTAHEAGGFNPRGSEYGKLRGVARDWNDGTVGKLSSPVRSALAALRGGCRQLCPSNPGSGQRVLLLQFPTDWNCAGSPQPKATRKRENPADDHATLPRVHHVI
jgi:hypothetical protein